MSNFAATSYRLAQWAEEERQRVKNLPGGGETQLLRDWLAFIGSSEASNDTIQTLVSAALKGETVPVTRDN